MAVRSFLVGAWLAVSAAGPSEAAQFLATYSGSVTSGIDNAGAFGTPGADLAGQSFTIDYSLLQPFPALVGAQFSAAANFQTTNGGTITGAPGPLSAVVTIAGRSQYVSGYYYGSASYQDNYLISDEGLVWDAVQHLAYGDTRNTSVYSTIGDYSAAMLSSPGIGARNAYSVHEGDERAGFFKTASLQGGSYLHTDLVLEPLSFRSGLAPGAPGVPEPSAWLMMLAGFGAVGAALRRSRRQRVGLDNYA